MNEILHAVFSTEGFVLGTLVPFLFVLTVVVFVHEMGHYLVGRWCGIGVKAFSIGFGPETLRLQRQPWHALETLRHTAWRLRQIRRRHERHLEPARLRKRSKR